MTLALCRYPSRACDPLAARHLKPSCSVWTVDHSSSLPLSRMVNGRSHSLPRGFQVHTHFPSFCRSQGMNTCSSAPTTLVNHAGFGLGASGAKKQGQRETGLGGSGRSSARHSRGVCAAAAPGPSPHKFCVASGCGCGCCLASLAPVWFLSLVFPTSGRGFLQIPNTIYINSFSQISQS